jgi:hypothetical protein
MIIILMREVDGGGESKLKRARWLQPGFQEEPALFLTVP